MHKNDMQNFESIRPYKDTEVPKAVKRLTSNIFFPWLVNTLAPDENLKAVTDKIKEIKTVKEFQEKVSFAVIRRIIDQSITKFTCEGWEQLDKNKPYLFVSNHRDIVLDAALLNYYFFLIDIPQTEITFGSNLMKNEISVDIGKLNRMFPISRSGNLRDLYRDYMVVSSYIRHVINEKKRSVWIAQRSGRTKDGNDKTEPAVLKMFAMSNDDNFVENISELSITPVSVSYEYESCAFAKAAEIYVSSLTKYKKSKYEDYYSIFNGVKAQKGNVNFVITPTITKEELEYCDSFEKTEKFVQLAKIIDKRIYDAYTLCKNNYIAYDILYKGNKFADQYDSNDKKIFLDYLANGINDLDIPNKSDIERILLDMYANPVKNKFSLK